MKNFLTADEVFALITHRYYDALEEGLNIEPRDVMLLIEHAGLANLVKTDRNRRLNNGLDTGKWFLGSFPIHVTQIDYPEVVVRANKIHRIQMGVLKNET